MAGRKISQLTSSLAPSLSGETVVVLSGTTYKTSLQSLRSVLVDSGSHYFTGSQYISGSLNVSGSSQIGSKPNDMHMVIGSAFVSGSLGSINSTVKEFLFVSGFAIIGDPVHHTGSDPEALHVGTTDSYNIAHFKGDNEYYSQVYITNNNSGSNASTDLVVVADNGTENVHFVDLGINSSTYTGGLVGRENDAYLLNVGKDLYVGTVGGTEHPAKLHLFAENSWENPQITVHTGSQVTFNTSGFTEGYLYEFSGSVKLQNELKVDGSVTASYFVGDGSRLTNLPNGLGSGDIADFTFTSETITNGNVNIVATDGDIILNADGGVYIGSNNSGNGIVTDSNFESVIGDTSRINNGTGHSITDNLDNAVYYLNLATSSYATTGSNTFVDNQIISGSKYLSVGTIQNLSGSLDLITSGNSINILSSNLFVPNGGILTSFDLSVSGSATIGGTLNLGQTTERITSATTSNTIGNFDFNDSSVFYITGVTSDFSAYVWNVPDFTNKGIGLSFMIEQGSTPYIINELVVNDGAISILWNGGTPPTGHANNLDIMSFSLININGTISALGQLTTFA